MRRREKFVISAVILSLGLLIVQYIPLEFRYIAVAVFTLLTYLMSAWALSNDLQWHEWFTILPLPALYAGSVGLFYFLLPANFASRVSIFILFGVGMYALYLTANIYSVAKGRTIQLVHAAHAIGFLFTLIISLLSSNTIFSLRLPFYWTSLLVGLVHFPLIYMSLWSVRLESYQKKEILVLSVLLSMLTLELALILCFIPFSIWHYALFIMSFTYIGMGVLHNHLKERLFGKTLREYTLVAAFVLVVFFLLFPLK